jgi:hypothetical protein
MKAAMILGYVEDKPVGENLDQVLKSERIARYRQLSNNILLTDYLKFIWDKDGKVNGRAEIAFRDDLEGKAKKPRADRVKAVSDLLGASSPPRRKASPALSTSRSRLPRAAIFCGTFSTLSNFPRSGLSRADARRIRRCFCADACLGLFLAKLNSNGEVITLANARQFVPGSFRLIRELVQFLDDLSAPEYAEIRWVVEEILSIVNGLKLEIHEDLSFKHRKAIIRKVGAKDEEEHRLFERDPFIYFYEDFLGKYDAKMKKARGVYYTPPPIVNFIVRAVDDILKETFGIPDGLADHKRVTVLDFACGTGRSFSASSTTSAGRMPGAPNRLCASTC